jgi:proline racemase
MATLQELVEHLAGSGQMNDVGRGIRVVDSHTEGEPTRVVWSGGPDLGKGPLRDRLQRFREAADDFGER